MKRDKTLVSYFSRLLVVIVMYDMLEVINCNEKPLPVYYPNRIIFANDTKSFTLRVTRFICSETPYEVSELLHCKTVLRRNKPTFFNISLHVPMVVNTMYFQVKTYYRLNDYQAFPIDLNVDVCAYFRNPSEDTISRHVTSIVFETLPQLLQYCPHENRTYNVGFWLEEKFFPKSMPAGDYRMDVWFRTAQNKTLFAFHAYFSVRRMDMDKIRNMTDVLHMDRSTHIVPTHLGFRVVGKDFEIHFDRINVTHAGEDDSSNQPQQDFMPTLVKRKTYVWEITRRQPTANITVPVFLGKHDKQAIPPYQNAIPPPDSDTKKD